MFYLISIGLFFPLLGFIFLALTSSHLNRKLIEYTGCFTVLVSFICFATLAFFSIQQDFLFYPWIHLKGLQADFTLHLDHLSSLMTLIITGVGFLIHVYSIGYMEEDKSIGRYFACMNLFIFSMLLLVLAGDLLLLFVGWEGVGLASYLLIGFWYEKESASNAAVKAFIVNRIGDFGFLLGILLAFFLFGTSNIDVINAASASPEITLLTVLLLCGAVAKSAQLPLHVWLPDAMEGPTPVSALIHAATMVTAGVYLIARLHPLFLLAPETMMWIGILGGTTALFASIVALNQTDLKRVLAYSTVSQLGLMFLASGIGAFYAAMFHLTMHAFMKALLFLGAGNVIHMLHGSTEMDEMGGLSKRLKATNWLFLIGVLAMSGVPPLAAFFSKDLILDVEYHTGHTIFFALAVITSILTAIYLTRAYLLTFQGQEQKNHSHVHEAPKVMLIPVAILAGLAVIGGWIGYAYGSATPFLESYLSELGIIPAEQEFTDDLWTSPETWYAIAMAVFGVGITVFIYRRFYDLLEKTYPLLKKGFYFDALYHYLFVVPYTFIAEMIAHVSEPYFFEQIIQGFSLGALKTGFALQKFQSGQIRSYAAWMVLGGVCMLIYFVS